MLAIVPAQKLFGILCVVGVYFVVSGMYFDDVTYWFVADMYFIGIFAGSAVLFYVTIKRDQNG